MRECESVVRDEAGKGLTAGSACCASLTDDSSSILEPVQVGKNLLPRDVSTHTYIHTYAHSFLFFFKEKDERKETLLLVLNIS